MGKILEKITTKLKVAKTKLGKKTQLIIAGILTIIMLIIFFNGITDNKSNSENKSITKKITRVIAEKKRNQPSLLYQVSLAIKI